MSSAPLRTRVTGYQEDSDEWLIDAARRAGHQLPRRDRPPGTSAWRILLNAGVDDDEILRLACVASGTEPADFARASPALSSLLSHPVAMKYHVAPTGVYKGVLGIATFNPQSAVLERELAFASKQRVSLFAASPAVIMRAQAAIYGNVYGVTLDTEPRGLAAAAPLAATKTPIARLSLGMAIPAEAQSPPQNLTERLLSTAVTERAAEAHLEPVQDGGLIARLRIDGAMNDRFRVSQANAAPLIQSLKQLAGLDPDEKSRPQHGRASFASSQGLVELRVSVEPLPSALEKVTIRLFTPQAMLGLADLGLAPSDQQRLEQLVAPGEGLMVVAGPPGSGKTTTMYAMIKQLRQRGRRAATVEEPVEYPLEGVQQVQVSDSPYPTFAAAARATMGAEADVVLLGALADPATAASAVEWSREKRLALAGLDAVDLVSAIERLYELDVDAAALALVLKGVVVQRLVRQLCPTCALPQEVSELPEPQQRLLFGLPTNKLRRPIGCAQCRGTGFAGRTAVAQVLAIPPEIRSAMSRHAALAEIAQLARECGMNTLWDSGMKFVVEGTTTLGELLDNVPAPVESDNGAAAQQDIDALLAQLLGSPDSQPTPSISAVPVPAPVTAPAPAPQPTTPAPANLRVLLVDDDAAARRSLANDLREAGMSVIEAADGEAALSFAQRLKPDLLLTDITLPKLDALGLTQALVAAGSKTKIVIHTAQQDEALHAWLREAGAASIMPRNMLVDTLVQRLKELVPANH
jgi:type II secretory ATPase GspE/PulE/Tfp pilus assembly ATPase PilB-like protein